MALPFIAGLVVGSAVAFAFTKREVIKESIENGSLKDTMDKGKELSQAACEKISSSFSSIKSNFKGIVSQDDNVEVKKQTTKRKAKQ